jgi:hypothetical protein
VVAVVAVAEAEVEAEDAGEEAAVADMITATVVAAVEEAAIGGNASRREPCLDFVLHWPFRASPLFGCRTK